MAGGHTVKVVNIWNAVNVELNMVKIIEVVNIMQCTQIKGGQRGKVVIISMASKYWWSTSGIKHRGKWSTYR